MQVSVYDYYCSEYPNFTKVYKLDPDANCIKVGSKNNLKLFPIEVVQLEDNEVYRKKLKPYLQGGVTRKSSSQNPKERFDGIINQIGNIQKDNIVNGTDYFKHFGISIEKTPVVVDARIIDAPELQYKDKKINTFNKGSWDIKDDIEFYKPCNSISKNWALINIEKFKGNKCRNTIFSSKCQNFIKSLIGQAKNKGIDISTPNYTDFQFDYRGKGIFEKKFKEIIASDPKLKLVIILIPSQDEIYNEIKAVAELQLGIITQCMNQVRLN